MDNNDSEDYDLDNEILMKALKTKPLLPNDEISSSEMRSKTNQNIENNSFNFSKDSGFPWLMNQSEFTSFKDIEKDTKTYEVHYATWTEVKNNNSYIKNYSFNYDSSARYKANITATNNVSYCKGKESPKQIIRSSINQVYPILYFDYQKYTIELKLRKAVQKYETHSSRKDYHEISIEWNSETTSIALANRDTIDKILKTKKIINRNLFESFKYACEAYYVIELDTKERFEKTSIIEDGIISVTYWLISKDSDYLSLYTKLIYSMLFSRQSLENYVIKYIYEMVSEFTNFPNESFLDLWNSINFNECNSWTDEWETLKDVSIKSKIKHIKANGANLNIRRQQFQLPLHKLIILNTKYDWYYNKKDFEMSTAYYSRVKKEKILSCLKNSFLDDPSAKASGVYKFDILKLTRWWFSKISKSIKTNFSPSSKEYVHNATVNYLITLISTKLSMFSKYKGFFNIEQIINDDEMIESNCCKFCNKKCEKYYNTFSQSFWSCLWNKINYFLNANEGLYHKHLSVNNLSFNFNDKNIVHVFKHSIDSSVKNRIRIYDIPMHNNWLRMISVWILKVFKDCYDFDFGVGDGTGNNKDENEKILEFHRVFRDITEWIVKEFIDSYDEGLPNYYDFCRTMGKTPLKRYNIIDNLCQHFANNSAEKLLRDVCQLSPIVDSLRLNNENTLPKPKLNTIFEPYLFLCDKKIISFLESKNKKSFLTRLGYSPIELIVKIEKWYSRIKQKPITNLINHKGFMSEANTSSEIVFIPWMQNSESSLSSSASQIPLNPWTNCTSVKTKNTFDYMLMLNLTFYYKYKMLKKVRKTMVEYYKLCRLIDHWTSMSNDSINDLMTSTLIKNDNIEYSYEHAKQSRKELKKKWTEFYEIINQLEKAGWKLCLWFSEYLNLEEISIDAKDTTKGKTKYIRVGYFWVDYKHVNEVNREYEREWISKSFLNC